MTSQHKAPSFSQELLANCSNHWLIQENIPWRVTITVGWTCQQLLPDNNTEKPFEGPVLLTMGTYLQAEITHFQSLMEMQSSTEYSFIKSLSSEVQGPKKIHSQKMVMSSTGEYMGSISTHHNARENSGRHRWDRGRRKPGCSGSEMH